MKGLSDLTQGADSISTYYTKLKRSWDEMRSIWALPTCTCGATKKIIKHEEDHRLVQFLMGLNDSYSTVRGNILMMSPLPTITGAYSLLIQEEKQREISNNAQISLDASAFASQRKWDNHQSHVKGIKQGFQGQYNNVNFRNNQNRFQTKRSNYFCTHCDMSGHSNERCYILHPELKNKNQNKRMAAVAQNEGNGVMQTSHLAACNISYPSASQEYHDIIASFNKQNIDTSSFSKGHSMVAGPVNDYSPSSW
ncbi:hypothetical protein RND81_11G019600 [Saponaria officinalis]|uniref:Uncharacterized protein n=1 Tax=Saponaria officinalis TaxID=3572 RepID=A0AAW1HG57_SAPOF